MIAGITIPFGNKVQSALFDKLERDRSILWEVKGC